MSFVINPGVIQTPLTAGGIAYGTGSSAKVNAAGTSGQFLRSNGTATPSWFTSTASVSSVAMTVPSVFSVSGSPITTSGTLAVSYSGIALPIANGGTGTTLTTFADLTTNVTGTLPIANGGTGTTSTTFVNAATNVTGTLPVANGGTNSTATPTAGTVPYGTGTAFAFTSAGTSGQLLQSNGASAPTWVTASAGAMVLLQTITASNSATVDLETGIDSTYDAYVILVSGWVTLSGLYVNLKIGGSYRTDAFYSFVYNSSISTSSTYTGTNNSNYAFGIGINADGDLQGSSTIYFNNPSSTTLKKQLSYTGMSFIGSGPPHLRTNIGVGNYSNLTSALTGVRFKSGSGNITSGTFSLYGFSK